MVSWKSQRFSCLTLLARKLFQRLRWWSNRPWRIRLWPRMFRNLYLWVDHYSRASFLQSRCHPHTNLNCHALIQFIRHLLTWWLRFVCWPSTWIDIETKSNNQRNFRSQSILGRCPLSFVFRYFQACSRISKANLPYEYYSPPLQYEEVFLSFHFRRKAAPVKQDLNLRNVAG